MLPIIGSKCMNGHEGVRLCSDKGCTYPATICAKETCLWSTKHNRCNGCVHIDYFVEKMRIREDGNKMDNVLEVYDKMIKRIEVDKKEYEKTTNMSRRNGNQEQQFFDWLKENSSRKIDSRIVNKIQKKCKQFENNQANVDQIEINKIQKRFENVLVEIKRLWKKHDSLQTNKSKTQLKSMSSSLQLFLNNKISKKVSLNEFLSNKQQLKKSPFAFTYFKISNNLQIYNEGKSIRNQKLLEKQIYHLALISPKVSRNNSFIKYTTNTASNIQFGIFDMTNIQNYQLYSFQLENHILFPTKLPLTPRSYTPRSNTPRSYKSRFSIPQQSFKQQISLSIDISQKTITFQNITKQTVECRHIFMNKNNSYYFGIVLHQKGNVTICQ